MEEVKVVRLWSTRDEICAELGVSPRTLTRMVAAGQVQSRKHGRENRYRAAAPKTSPAQTDAKALAAVADLARDNGQELRAALAREADLRVRVAELETELAHTKEELTRAREGRRQRLGRILRQLLGG